MDFTELFVDVDDFTKGFEVELERYRLVDDRSRRRREDLEYQIRDRVSFMRFLGLTLHDDVPDEKTIWLFEDALTKRGLVQA